MKSLIVFFLILNLSFNLLGQKHTVSLIKEKPSFGVVIGLNTSWLSSKSLPNNAPKLGFNGGLSMTYPISSRFFLNSSLIYSKYKNSKRSQLDPQFIPDYYLEELMKCSWLELPLTFNYSFIKKGKLSISAGAGLSVAKLLNSEIIIKTQTTFKSSTTIPYYNQTKPLNFFPLIQSGVAIRTSEHDSLIITIFYQASLSELYKPIVTNPNPNVDITIIDDAKRLNVVGLTIQYTTQFRR